MKSPLDCITSLSVTAPEEVIVALPAETIRLEFTPNVVSSPLVKEASPVDEIQH